CDRGDATQGKPLTQLTPAEARTMRAFAAQVLPSSDGTPGADEAGAIHFVDRAFGTLFFADTVPLVRAGLARLDSLAKSAGARNGFASLASAEQIALMRRVESEPFFAAARLLVVVGTLADPTYGGNRDMAGWRMMGIDHQPAYHAPFGWYDAAAGSTPT